MQINNKTLSLSQEQIDVVKDIPAVKRAKILYKLNQKHEARLELYYLMQQSDTLRQYIIIKLVSDWGWIPQALHLSRKADHRDDVSLRFPLSYNNFILSNADKHKLNPALIYAIIRKESYFMPNAHSPAGAVGLMQLMPSTAYKTSKQYKLEYSGREDLLHGNTNIKLGSAHLNKLHQQFDQHSILVIAAYNAGRRAVNRWIPRGKNIPADIWIETVPFYETRSYIKHVIAYYIVYQYRLGQTPNLDNIMKAVK